MKRFNFMMALLLGFTQMQAAPFILHGKVTGKASGYIYLILMGTKYRDSCKIVNNSFVFKGNINGPASAMLTKDLKSWSGPSAEVYLEPGTMAITISADYKVQKMTGSKSEEEYLTLEHAMEPDRAGVIPLSKAYEKLNMQFSKRKHAGQTEEQLKPLSDSMESLKEQMEPFQEKMQVETLAFFRAHPQSFVTASMLRYYTSDMSADTLQLYYDRLSPELQQSDAGKVLAADLDQLKKGSPGSPSHDFTTKDINGQPLSLSMFKGKYVLLDFWASWCVPCRAGNPHLKELYGKYKDKGFEIIGVADNDGTADEWKKAVAKDGIGIWKHVLRGLDIEKLRASGYDPSKPDPNDISSGYGIHTLPTQILISPSGTIIGRYGGGGEEHEMLDKKLAEVLK
jgi:thiol-disulfide isomerase/thioredoxin